MSNDSLYLIRWTVRDSETSEFLPDASGEGELDCEEPRDDEALRLLADMCSRPVERLGVELEESPRRVTITVEVIEASTEWDGEGPYNHEAVIDTEVCDRILPAAE